ncbi:hypothetical protein [Streptomyces sp. NBRC 109706]|uniref:hypothetical protein n=1 Tax=Streptomyces sp. NBRC 109706 TaxID=1550035 RepID=UPI000B10372F|nr:hypothetical protein [Streptomyces sp. NBRC 109706]
MVSDIARTRTADRAPWPGRWPVWAPPAALLWAFGYAALQLGWVLTDTTVPWSPTVTYPGAAHGALAALAMATAPVVIGTRGAARRLGGRLTSGALLGLLAVFASGMLSLPAHLVTIASFSGVDSVTGIVQLLAHTVGVCLLLLVLVSWHRRTRAVCVRCGRSHTGGAEGPLRHPEPTVAARRTRITVYLLMCGFLPWAVAKTIWTLGGDALGVSAEGWREASEGESALTRALAQVGIDVTVLAAGVGVFLLLGLLYRWGQVFPRWAPPLTGRRVPRLLPLAPAWLCGVGLALYGVVLVVYASLSGVGVLPSMTPEEPFTSASGLTWMTLFGGLAFGGLGFGMLTAARSYAERTRPSCTPATPAPDRVPAVDGA